MEIKAKKIKHEVDGAVFTFRDLTEEELFSFLDERSLKNRFAIAKKALEEVEGITLNGDAISLEQFKAMPLSTDTIIKITKGLDSALASFFSGEEDAEKNEG